MVYSTYIFGNIGDGFLRVTMFFPKVGTGENPKLPRLGDVLGGLALRLGGCFDMFCLIRLINCLVLRCFCGSLLMIFRLEYEKHMCF